MSFLTGFFYLLNVTFMDTLTTSFKIQIQTYGYPAILTGTIVEGETVLMLAGMFASLGYLDLPLVILMAILGSYGGDQFFFIWVAIKDTGY